MQRSNIHICNSSDPVLNIQPAVGGLGQVSGTKAYLASNFRKTATHSARYTSNARESDLYIGWQCIKRKV